MCKGGLFHWHSAREESAKKVVERYKKYGTEILSLIRREEARYLSKETVYANG